MPDAAPVTSATRPSMVAMFLILPALGARRRPGTPFQAPDTSERPCPARNGLVGHLNPWEPCQPRHKQNGWPAGSRNTRNAVPG